MTKHSYIGILDGDQTDEERKRQEKEMEDLMLEFENTRIRRDFFKYFTNLPFKIQKRVLLNFVIACNVLLLCVGTFIAYYKNPMLLVVGIGIPFYLFIQSCSTYYYFRNMDFTEFEGRVIESYPMGNKTLKTDYYLVKLENENHKTLCFRYYDKTPIYFDEILVLFLRKGTKVIPGEHGPMIETYIDLIPKEELESRLKAHINKKENGKKGNVSIEQFVK